VPGAVTEHGEAGVILDVELERGLFYLVLENLGDEPAHAVRVRFDAPLSGLGGERRIDRLQLFRRLEFLGPRRRIRVFLDRSALLFARDEPTALAVTVVWRTDRGERALARHPRASPLLDAIATSRIIDGNHPVLRRRETPLNCPGRSSHCKGGPCPSPVRHSSKTNWRR